MYVLGTGYDVDADDGDGDETAVGILAVRWKQDSSAGMI